MLDYKRKEYETQSFEIKCEVCGGTREALEIRCTLLDSAAGRVGLSYLPRAVNH